MLNSLKLYLNYFLRISLSPEKKYVTHEIQRFLLNRNVFTFQYNFSDNERRTALENAVNWLITAQKANNDGGMGSFHLLNKWSSTYPETTGYIIPTLLKYGNSHKQTETVDSALRAANFLVKIQKPSGGWQGGRIHENKPEIVFNTGQVIRGMIAAYEQSDNKIYLESAVRAGDWLAEILHPEGYWKTHALMNQPRVYDTFVDAPLLDLFRLTGNKKYQQVAVKNLEWVINEKMHDNGWFEDCDNTVKRNDRPILHTIAYTLDGLIDCGLKLNDEKYIKAAMKGAVVLRDAFLSRGFLNGRYNRDWIGSEYMICTGCAQMSIIWLKFYNITGESEFIEAAHKMINLLIFIQSRAFKENDDTKGAISGSFPLWGRYEPFAFPNWATKFFCDALLLEEELQ